MKKSIRYLYTIIFASVIAVILFSIWCAYNLFLVNFYIRDKEKILEKSHSQIEEMLNNDEITLQSGQSETLDPELPGNAYLRELMEKYNISILLVDRKSGEYLSSEPRNGRFMEVQMRELYSAQQKEPKEPKPPDFVPVVPPEEIEILKMTEEYTMQKIYNHRSKSTYLQSYGHFPDSEVDFLMSLPLASIQESVSLANRFLTIISLIALFLGSVVIFVTTKKIAEPILELSKLSEQMSEMNFGVRYTGKSVNEIGTLGNSMNVLSEKLKQTMGELKSANIKLQADIEQKIKIDEMRKDFVSNVSHELKTPITIIHGYAEGLSDGMCKDEESRNFYYQVILNESDKMTALVKQLLNLSDLEFGFDLPQIERFNLTELTADVLNSLDVLFKDKGVTVEFQQKDPIFVWADEFKIEEVLKNYLSNALNHLGGEKKICISIETQDQIVKITVFNTGKQIPETELDKLWLKFYKVDKARTREYGGSGIGLSIVKAIMDSHHRECGAENRADGVAFWFTLDQNLSDGGLEKGEIL